MEFCWLIFVTSRMEDSMLTSTSLRLIMSSILAWNQSSKRVTAEGALKRITGRRMLVRPWSVSDPELRKLFQQVTLRRYTHSVGSPTDTLDLLLPQRLPCTVPTPISFAVPRRHHQAIIQLTTRRTKPKPELPGRPAAGLETTSSSFAMFLRAQAPAS